MCRYESGDHVAVYPINDSVIVNRIGDLLDVDLDTVISLNNLDGMTWAAHSVMITEAAQLKYVCFLSEESNKKHPFPCPTTYRTALTHYLDITNPPRTNVLYELAQYATEPKDQESMKKMASSSPEGKVRSPAHCTDQAIH